MGQSNPFQGVKTYQSYWRLWALTAAVILLQAAATVFSVLAERRIGTEFTAFENIIPAFLATGLLSYVVLAGMGVSCRAALDDWRRKFLLDALKALKYFGGYLLVVVCIVTALMAAWWLLPDGGLEKVMEPVTAKSSKESEMLQAVSVSRLRLLLSFFSVCVLGPVVEELFFRRIFYTTVRARKGFWFSAFWSGLFFALFHGAAAPLLLPVGIYFCWVYEREARLPVNIMLHSLVNLTMFLNRMTY